MNGFLGIDTSCYTTSISFLNERGQLVADLRKPLEVKPGGRGLSQSEMVFQHTRNLPVLLEQFVAELDCSKPKLLGIGVSARPRTAEGSYMPVFVIGESFARSLATVTEAPIHRLSHQENHILAGIRSAGRPASREFLAVHMSGGTTEIVKTILNPTTIQVELISESCDLHAGQFIDRVGVALGLPFPAGPHLERLALEAKEILKIPVSCQGANISFSGPETFVQRAIAKEHKPEQVAAGVQRCIAASITAMIAYAAGQTGLREVLIVGGVAANRYIRGYLTEQLNAKRIRLLFPEPVFSSDNATGTAFFAYQCGTSMTPSA